MKCAAKPAEEQRRKYITASGLRIEVAPVVLLPLVARPDRTADGRTFLVQLEVGRLEESRQRSASWSSAAPAIAGGWVKKTSTNAVTCDKSVVQMGQFAPDCWTYCNESNTFNVVDAVL